MKGILLIPLIMLTVMPMAICDDLNTDPAFPEQPGQPGNSGGGDEDNSINLTSPIPGGNKRYLVLYCLHTGSTEHMAQQIQQTLDCDVLEVEPQTPYENDYDGMLNHAQEKLAAIHQGNYPAIKTSVEDFGSYDIVFVNYPIWHGSVVIPMQTLLHDHASKLTDKRIALFASSGSSGISISVDETRIPCSGITSTKTLPLTSLTLSQVGNRIRTWLETFGASRENNYPSTSTNVKIIVDNRTITAMMGDNAAAQNFLSRPPLEVMLNDYNNITEKIFYPSPALITAGMPRGYTPVPGDITVYVPWNSVAISCRSGSQSNDLIKIGRIDDNGIDALNVPDNVTVKFGRQ